MHGTMGYEPNALLRANESEFMIYDRHKDYLFQKKLAKALPMDSFRFDFR